jgi:hypothetical protein
MTVYPGDYGPVDWLRKIDKSCLDGLVNHCKEGEINYRALADIAREIQNDAQKMEQKAVSFLQAERREFSLRVETVAQDVIFNKAEYNQFAEEAQKKSLEIVMLIELGSGGYRGPAVLLKEEPVYLNDPKRGWCHPEFQVKTIRRKFNDGWALYPDNF